MREHLNKVKDIPFMVQENERMKKIKIIEKEKARGMSLEV